MTDNRDKESFYAFLKVDFTDGHSEIIGLYDHEDHIDAAIRIGSDSTGLILSWTPIRFTIDEIQSVLSKREM